MATASAITAAKAFVEVGVKGTDEASAKMQQMLEKIDTSVKKVGTTTKASLGLQVAQTVGSILQTIANGIKRTFNFIVSQVSDSMDRISNIVKRADRLGVGIGFMSSLQVMAQDSQVSLDEIEQAFAAFQRNIVTAALGVGESRQTMLDLGLNPEELKSMGLEAAIAKVTVALSQIPDQSARAGAAMRIFGEQGRKLLPILTGSTDLMEALSSQSEYLGTTFDEEGARGVDNWRDSWKKLSMQLNALWDQFTMKIAPIFSQIIDGAIIPFIHVMGELIGLFDDGGLGADTMSNSMSLLMIFVKGLTSVIIGLVNEFIWMGSVVTGMIGRAWKMYADIRSLMGGEGSTDVIEARRLSESWAGYEESLGKTASKVSTYMNNFYANFDEAQAEWAALVQKERDATQRGITEPAEEIAAAVTELGEVFKGEALQRNASTMQRIQETHLKNSKEIKDYVKKIAGMLGKTELLMAAE